MTKNRNLVLSIVLGVLVPLAVVASNLSTPFTFTSGTPIKSADVNANFAAVQTAVNSKADVTDVATKSGTRLKLLGLRSPDGMAMSISGFGGSNGIGIYDSMLSMMCLPGIATDGLIRCVPVPLSFGGSDPFFSDTICTQVLFVDGPSNGTIPGLPVPTAKYVTTNTFTVDGGQGQAVYDTTLYGGTVYQNDFTIIDGGSPCKAIPSPGVPLRQRTTLIPPGNLAQIQPTTL